MFVLKSQGIEPMLIGLLGIKSYEGIYIEVDEVNVPKKYKFEKLSGCAVRNDKYMRSNTSGITHGKYFEKIAEALDFKPIQEEKFKMFEDSSIRYEWNRVLKILEETDNNSVYRINFEPVGDKIFNLKVTRYLNESEIEVQEHKFKEYEDSFRGMYSFSVKIQFTSVTKEQLEEIREISDKHIITVDLDMLKTIVDRYNLAIAKEGYHCSFYSKERTPNFSGKHSEGIDVFNKNFHEIITFSEATEKWQLSDSTLRKLVKTNKIKENIDYRKSGKVWLITRSAMEKIYGKLKG